MGVFQNIRGPELLIILLIIVLLFGAKKLPETARGLGRSLRIFKAETKGLNEDEAAAQPAAPPAPQQAIEASGPVPAAPVPPAAPAAEVPAPHAPSSASDDR